MARGDDQFVLMAFEEHFRFRELCSIPGSLPDLAGAWQAHSGMPGEQVAWLRQRKTGRHTLQIFQAMEDLQGSTYS